MGHSFSTCDCVDYDTFEDNIRIRRMENGIKKQRISELSKKKFYSIPDDEKVMEVEEELEEEPDDDVKYQSETEKVQVLHIETEEVRLEEPDNVREIEIINPKSPAIKQIDEIINYLQQIPTDQYQELP
jgi:DNA polymerase elongation subunit (family B)